jgi:hypothetical protein
VLTVEQKDDHMVDCSVELLTADMMVVRSAAAMEIVKVVQKVVQ